MLKARCCFPSIPPSKRNQGEQTILCIPVLQTLGQSHRSPLYPILCRTVCSYHSTRFCPLLCLFLTSCISYRVQPCCRQCEQYDVIVVQDDPFQICTTLQPGAYHVTCEPVKFAFRYLPMGIWRSSIVHVHGRVSQHKPSQRLVTPSPSTLAVCGRSLSEGRTKSNCRLEH